MNSLSPETMEKLRTTSTATLTTQLFRHGLRNTYLQGVRPLTGHSGNMVGPAFTLRYVPAREDLDSFGAKPDPNALQREAIESVPAGHVLVMDCRQDARAASAGDVYITRLYARGVAGLVSDGGIRDSAAIRGMALPVYCAGPSAPTNRVLHHAVDCGLPIACGGVAVYPGDIVVGDADGICIIPRALADEVARDGAEQEELESFIQRRVAGGEALPGLYPVNEQTRAEYRAWKDAQQKTSAVDQR
jgi:regulator of RNase E activity RraA